MNKGLIKAAAVETFKTYLIKDLAEGQAVKNSIMYLFYV